MAKNNIQITEPYQLLNITIWPLPFFRPETTISIVSRDVPPDQKKAWEEQLAQRMEDCGCELAGMGFMIGVFAYLLWIGFGPVKLANLNWVHVWQGLLTTIIGLALGKMTGLFRARMRLSRLVGQIQETWNQDFNASPDSLPSAVIEK